MHHDLTDTRIGKKVNPSPPFWLYDKHIDTKLNLIHVKLMPSLLGSLAALADATLNDVAGSDITLLVIGPESFFFCVSYQKYSCCMLRHTKPITRLSRAYKNQTTEM